MKKGTTRVSLDLTPKEKAELDRIVGATGTRTRARLLRQAFKFYGVLVDHKQQGFLIQAIRGGQLYQFPELDVPYPKLVTGVKK